MQTEVLIVDDSVDLRAFLATVLEDDGYAVLQAPDGQRGLDRLRQHPSGLVVLLDLNMPIMSGFDVLRAVDAEDALAQRHAYIVMSSATSDELPADFLELVRRRCIPVLTKPCEMSELLAAVVSAVKRISTPA